MSRFAWSHLLLLCVLLTPCVAIAAPAVPLRWGVDTQGGAPYAFTDPNHPDRVIGFEQDIADALGRRLHRPVTRLQVDWDSLIPALRRGTLDFAMNGIEITPEHARGALFTRPYYVFSEQIAVRKNDTRIHDLADLKGRTVGTMSNTVAQRMLDRMGGVDIKFYADPNAAYEDTAIGRIDAVFLDRPMAAYYVPRIPGLRLLEPAVGEGYYGIALRPGDTALKKQLDGAIAGMLADGTLQRILTRWNLWDDRQAKLKQTLSATSASATGDLWHFLPTLLRGAVMTVSLSVLAMALAMALGLCLAVTRLYGPRPARWLATTYVEIFRGTPLLIQLYLIYYGLPALGIRFEAFAAGVVGLGLNYAAYEAENYRAGIQAVPHGQTEASLALGMSRLQALRHVVLPQALRVAVPPVANDFIALFKDSSLVSVITLVELTKAYGMLAAATFDYIRLGLLTALIYLAISYPASLLARWTESRLRRIGGAA
ncbi:MAG TPA: ABC transporter substrate-binding protein/permease [Oscillatoriaceae cyanobacterium]